VEQHVTCPEYLAARQRRSAELARDRISFEQLDSLRFQPSARATPVALERPRTSDAPPAALMGVETRSVARSARMPIAIGVIVVVALFGGSKFLGGSAPPSPSPTARATSSVAASPSGGASPSEGTLATPTPDASLGPTPIVATRTYKIKRGDSLGKIARQFGTTVDELKRLNDFGDPPRIRVGQVINIP
jgi:nucleoid-associated protein YgaU